MRGQFGETATGDAPEGDLCVAIFPQVTAFADPQTRLFWA